MFRGLFPWALRLSIQPQLEGRIVLWDKDFVGRQGLRNPSALTTADAISAQARLSRRSLPADRHRGPAQHEAVCPGR